MADVASPSAGPLSGPTGQRVVSRLDAVREVLHRHGVTNVRVFGSVARGDDHEGSDLDLLVDFAPGTSLFDVVGIQLELEDLLGVEVDLISENGLKPRIRPRVERDLVPL